MRSREGSENQEHEEIKLDNDANIRNEISMSYRKRLIKDLMKQVDSAQSPKICVYKIVFYVI